MLISLVLHGFMLGLLFVTPYWSGLTPDADLNPIIDGFNVELVDVTMDDVKFNPKDFEKAKVVREKKRKAEEASPEKNNISADVSNNLSEESTVLPTKAQTHVAGSDNEDREGPGNLDGETKRILMSYKDYLSNYLNSSKEYPRMAEKLRQEGMVVLVLEIDAKGLITDLKVKKSSNFKSLDVAALNHVRSLAPFKELPQDVGQYRVEVPIIYKIN